MKRIKIFSILICLLISGNISAQKNIVENLPKFDLEPYHFGFILGMNQMFFSIKPEAGFMKVKYDALGTPDLTSDSSFLQSIESNSTTGFVIGIVSNLRMGDRFDLRFIPSLSFGERQMAYNMLGYNAGVAENFTVIKKVQSTFVEFPLYIRYKGRRINNVLPYVLGGGKYAIDLASNSKKREDNNNINVAIERSDLYAEIGVGFDFYTAWFKFGTEVKMSYGIRDMLKHDKTIYTRGIDQFHSRLFQLSFSFE